MTHHSNQYFILCETSVRLAKFTHHDYQIDIIKTMKIQPFFLIQGFPKSLNNLTEE